METAMNGSYLFTSDELSIYGYKFESSAAATKFINSVKSSLVSMIDKEYNKFQNSDHCHDGDFYELNMPFGFTVLCHQPVNSYYYCNYHPVTDKLENRIYKIFSPLDRNSEPCAIHNLFTATNDNNLKDLLGDVVTANSLEEILATPEIRVSDIPVEAETLEQLARDLYDKISFSVEP